MSSLYPCLRPNVYSAAEHTKPLRSRTQPLLMLSLMIGLLGLSGQIHAASDEDDAIKSFSAAIVEAQAAPGRPAKDVARDSNRKPADTLAFFGLRSDMKVLELLPGGGWYTRLLAPALADEGELFLSIGAERLQDSLLKEPGFDQVEVLSPDVGFARNGPLYTLAPFSFGERGFDAVLTFRNLHNFDEAGRRNMNEAVFKALKRGGIYGVVDHTRRHMEADGPENRRRMDPVLAITELTQLGFEYVGYSDLHFRADDELRYEVGRRSVSGNTDRFTLLFRKP